MLRSRARSWSRRPEIPVPAKAPSDRGLCDTAVDSKAKSKTKLRDMHMTFGDRKRMLPDRNTRLTRVGGERRSGSANDDRQLAPAFGGGIAYSTVRNRRRRW